MKQVNSLTILMHKALDRLETIPKLGWILPEVGSNLVLADIGTISSKEVLGLDGRIIMVDSKAKVCGEIRTGYAPFMSRSLLAAQKIDPTICAAMSLRCSSATINCVKNMKIKIGAPWGLEQTRSPNTLGIFHDQQKCFAPTALNKLGFVPKALILPPGWGIEPILVFFSHTIEEILTLVTQLAECYIKTTEYKLRTQWHEGELS